MAKTRECCGALSLRRTGDDLHVSLHKGFKIRLAGIVPVFIEFTGAISLPLSGLCVDSKGKNRWVEGTWAEFTFLPLLNITFIVVTHVRLSILLMAEKSINHSIVI